MLLNQVKAYSLVQTFGLLILQHDFFYRTA